MQPIPECRYVIRKGEAPDPGRANILPWCALLALRPEAWEPFFGPLPPLPLKPGERPPAPPAIPSPEAMEQTRRASALLAALDRLESNEFTTGGVPKLEALRTLTGCDITTAERDAAWRQRKATTT
jgi:hypothetical protein